MSKNSLNTKGNVVILIVITVAVIVFVIFAGIYLMTKPQPQNNTQNAPSPTKTISTFTVYQITVSDQQKKPIDPSKLNIALFGKLGDNERKVFHDSTFNLTSNKGKFFVLTEKNAFKVGETYDKDSFEISVEKETPELLPYLSDPKYCIQDTDCSNDNNFCSIGAFNKYQRYVTYGCGMIASVEGVSEEEIKKLNCSINPGTGQPSYAARVESQKCIKNNCEAEKVTPYCL